MANVMRWRSGDTNPVEIKTSRICPIEIGDLVFIDKDGSAFPAKSIGKLFEGGHLQEEFASRFAGVAMQESRFGPEEEIRIATSGVFEFECLDHGIEKGQFITPTFDADESQVPTLRNGNVGVTPTEAESIGRCAQKKINGDGFKVLVEIESRVATAKVSDSMWDVIAKFKDCTASAGTKEEETKMETYEAEAKFKFKCPIGWVFLRYAIPKKGDKFINRCGEIETASQDWLADKRIILRKKFV